MTRFVKHSLITALFSTASLVFLLALPRDPDNIRFMGFSLLRLGLIGGFIFITGLLFFGIYACWKNKDWEQQADRGLQQLFSRPWLRELVLFLASATLFIGIFLAYQLTNIAEDQTRSILISLLPLIVFASALAAQVFTLEHLSVERKRWIQINLLCFLLFVTIRTCQSLQNSLLDTPFAFPARQNFIAGSGMILLTLASFAWFTKRSRPEKVVLLLVLLLASITFLLNWFLLPKKYWHTKRYLALYAPVLILGFGLLVTMFANTRQRLLSERHRIFRPMIYTSLAALFLVLAFYYYNAAVAHSKILNFRPSFSDQTDYMNFAKQARLRNFLYTGDHNRMPAYPFLQAVFYSPEISDAEFFEQGKTRNVILSLLLLAALFPIYLKYLHLYQAVTLLLIDAFSLYLFKAPYFQAEILFYFLSFLGFLLLLHMLVRPTWLLAVMSGVTLGLAHLTKASVLPALLMFIVIFLVKELRDLFRPGVPKTDKNSRLRSNLTNLIYLLIVVICYLAVIFPYIREMKQRFGHYFYNVNITFYIWFDDLNEALLAEEEHHFMDKWPDHLPSDEIPSPGKYFREHDLAQILNRIRFGISEQVNNIKSQYSVTNYHLLYLAIFLIVVLADIRNSVSLARRYPFLIGFVILYFLGYLAVFVWYAPVAPERRFTYGLYLPFMFAMFTGLRFLAENQRHKANQTGSSTNLSKIVLASHSLVIVTLVINIWLVLTERIYFDRFGS